ncbi:MAG: hypothetical protein CBB67_013845 [Alteromonadaceae bacterium TMED7]|nr:hypothetical protein [Alteromonadaceae bacterium]RPH16974.1 MAG: hypothetical protein CBB67_013845 [Alteromonadaceae bacterium TMED7]|tara:strand:- start:22774 stop:23604 length:831 start_codon:yes stop_codon:yes gene_type:complete
MNYPGILVFIASQRTGTSAFHRALRLTGQFAACYEVFYPVTDATVVPKGVDAAVFFGANFHRWYAAYPNKQSHWQQVLGDFFGYLCGQFTSRYVSLDFKYGQIEKLEALLNAPAGALVEFLNHNAIPVIHITRQNAFKRYLSNQLINMKYKPSYTQEDNHNIHASLTIDTSKCMQDIQAYQQKVAIYREALQGKPEGLEVSYESLFCNGKVNHEVVDFINRHLNAEFASVATDNIPTPVSYAACVANKHEIKKSELYARFGAMIDSVINYEDRGRL